eukprot:m.1032747 g.1032747  ORF g.1032747 m.1032747 type:complete len:996 (-) comp24126_c0_seq1:193-3180(-)
MDSWLCHVLGACTLLVASVAGWPQYKANQGDGCFLQVGHSAMGTTASRSSASGSACTLSLPSPLSAGQFIPGTTYTISVSGPNGKAMMVGATAPFGQSTGSWSSVSGGCTTTCSAGSGSYSGLHSRFSYTNAATVRWTAPQSTASVSLGATCGSFGAVETHQVRVTAPTPPPTSPAPTTAGPTSSPTLAPTCGGGFSVSLSDPAVCETNACVDFPCTGGNETCVNNPEDGTNSAAGRTCDCSRGYARVGGTGACTDADACTATPACPANTTCADLAPPALGDITGRVCSCLPGYTPHPTRAGECIDIDACSAGPCVNSNSTDTWVDPSRCLDTLGGVSGVDAFTCAPCPYGYTATSASNTLCRDTNGCTAGAPYEHNCTTDCVDAPAPPISTPPDYGAANFTCAALPCAGLTGFANVSGSGCVLCPAGTQPSPLRTACTSCGEGTAGENGVCSPCGVGTQANPGRSRCEACPGGTIRATTDQLSCTSCARLSYSVNTTTCATCTTDGYHVASTGDACVECPDPLIGTGGTCIECPLGFVRTSLTECSAPASQTTVTTTTTTNVIDTNSFCNRFIDICGGSLGWNDASACMADFPDYILGTYDQTAGHTRECRVYHLKVAFIADAAGNDAARQLHCGHASRSGASVCVGTPTPTDFCDQFLSTCGTTYGWTGAETCAEGVSSLLTGSAGGAGTPQQQTTTDTLGCRATMLSRAIGASSSSDVSTYCAQASARGVADDGSAPCSSAAPSIADFCTDFIDVCGVDDGWRDVRACVAMATRFLAGSKGSTSGNTSACRTYHLGVAKSSPAGSVRDLHCTHASPSGGGVCEGFATASDFCADFNVTCSTWENCESEFRATSRGFFDDVNGNTQGCRANQLSRAKSYARGSQDRLDACADAGDTGGSTCVNPTNAPTVQGGTAPPDVLVDPADVSDQAASGSSGDAQASTATTERWFANTDATSYYLVVWIITLLVGEYGLYLTGIQVLQKEHAGGSSEVE